MTRSGAGADRSRKVGRARAARRGGEDASRIEAGARRCGSSRRPSMTPGEGRGDPGAQVAPRSGRRRAHRRRARRRRDRGSRRGGAPALRPGRARTADRGRQDGRAVISAGRRSRCCPRSASPPRSRSRRCARRRRSFARVVVPALKSLAIVGQALDLPPTAKHVRSADPRVASATQGALWRSRRREFEAAAGSAPRRGRLLRGVHLPRAPPAFARSPTAT